MVISLPSLRRAGVLAMCCASVAGCGGSASGSGGSSSSASDSTARNAAQTRLQDCLREQGIDVGNGPGGGSGGGGGGPGRVSAADRQKVQDAMDGPCKKYQQAAFGNFDPNDPEVQDRQAKFRQCMSDAGIDLPDPGSGGGPPAGGGRIDSNDADTSAALKQCQSKLGAGGPGGGPPGGAGQ